MALKRKREGDMLEVNSDALLSSGTTSNDSAKLAIRHIMQEHSVSVRALREILSEDSITSSFYNVRYEVFAPFVGLDPDQEMRDIPTFHLHRSRISTPLFRSIVQDMDVLLPQYGLPVEHRTEEATSRFLAPIFNRLVAEFEFAFKNIPESTVNGSITTQDRIKYYFKAFGSISVLYIEIKLRIGSLTERLDAVAQVIAECQACKWNNSQRELSVPVYGILSDGQVFQFFLFEGSAKPFSFSRGTLSGDPPDLEYGFKLAGAEAPQPFLRDLRQICEIIFDLLLKSYVSTLAANSDRQECKEGGPRKNGSQWEQALNSARDAAQKFRAAETNRQNQSSEDTNAAVEVGMEALKRSLNLVPNIRKRNFIMSGWDDEEVERI